MEGIFYHSETWREADFLEIFRLNGAEGARCLRNREGIAFKDRKHNTAYTIRDGSVRVDSFFGDDVDSAVHAALLVSGVEQVGLEFLQAWPAEFLLAPRLIGLEELAGILGLTAGLTGGECSGVLWRGHGDLSWMRAGVALTQYREKVSFVCLDFKVGDIRAEDLDVWRGVVERLTAAGWVEGKPTVKGRG